MTTKLATALYVAFILGLFWLDRDRKDRVSPAVWLSVFWMSISCSRFVSQWLHPEPLGVVSTSDTPDRYLEGDSMDRVILGIVIFLAVVILIRRGRRVGALLRMNGPLLLFFVYCAVSTLWSDYPGVAFKRWIKAVGDVLMILLVLSDAHPVAAIKKFLSGVGFVLVPVSIMLIKYYPDLGRGYNPWVWTPYVVGVTTSKNFLGLLCLIFGLASEWRFLEALRGPKTRGRMGVMLAHASILAMVAWLLWKANSMTSLSCLIMGSGLIILAGMKITRRKPVILHLAVVCVLGLAISALFLNLGSGLVEDMGRDPTLTGRTEIWHLVLGMTGNSMFGTGFESFWLGDRLEKIWRIYWWHPNEAHDGYLEVYLNLGWVGVTLLGLLIVTGYRNALATLKRNPEVGKLRLAYLIIALAYNFTESAVRTMHPMWIIFLFAAIAVPDLTPVRKSAKAIPKETHAPPADLVLDQV
jgi:exopolysaccharide production protein ExoQ